MGRGARIGTIAAGGVALAALGATAVAGALWKRETTRSVFRLTHRKSASARQPPGTFSTDEIESLPAPVKRYFLAALRPGQPLVRSARLGQRGDFAMHPGTWSPFSATQHVAVRPPGFVWDASIRIAPGVTARVRDSYIGGVGRMHGRIAAIVPVVDQGGTAEMASGSLHRYLAEAPWVPTALLPSAGVVWSEVDDSRARATLSDRGTTVSVDFQFNDRGEIIGMSADRLRDVNGRAVLTPWVGRFWNYELVGGMMIPREGEVSWILPEGAYPYWRGRIVEASYTYEP